MKTKNILIVFVIALLSMPVYADSPESDSDEETPVEVYDTGIRPRDASQSERNVRCHYINGQLCFDFASPEGKATVTVTNLDNGTTIQDSFLTFQPHATYIGTASASYQINVKTSKGEYVGFLSI